MTTTERVPEVREIDKGTNPTRFARGWHCLGTTAMFRDGQPHQVEAFGASLVVFESADGSLAVLDAYCRHMGGNLAQGQIKDGNIACPFHDWRWGADGKCASVPYARRVPMRGRTRAWTTSEVSGQLFIWHDPEGNPPPPEVAIPEIEGYGSAEWTDWMWNQVHVTGSHCREIVDNVVDMAHFFYVHYAFPRYFKNIFEGHVATQYMHSTPRHDVLVGTNYGEDDSKLYSEASYFGPSYMIDWLTSETAQGTIETVLINCHYPISNNEFMLQYGVLVKKLPGMDDEQASEMARGFAEGVETGFLQDVEIWKNKTRIDNPLLTEEDGPVYQLRRWYQQFYVDVADVEPEMVNRFEFEIDTTRAVQSWEQEVAANLEKHGRTENAAPGAQ